MGIRIYNTLSRTKEDFEPVSPGRVGMYVCGPTVYAPSHIGHAVGPVLFDCIKRYLTFRGYQVTWVLNVTDVEDKLIARAREEGTTVAADGTVCRPFQANDRIVITRYGADFLLVRNPKRSEWHALRRKLRWGEGPNMH